MKRVLALYWTRTFINVQERTPNPSLNPVHTFPFYLFKFKALLLRHIRPGIPSGSFPSTVTTCMFEAHVFCSNFRWLFRALCTLTFISTILFYIFTISRLIMTLWLKHVAFTKANTGFLITNGSVDSSLIFWTTNFLEIPRSFSFPFVHLIFYQWHRS